MPMIISGQPAQDPRLDYVPSSSPRPHAPSRDSVQKQTVSSPSPVADEFLEKFNSLRYLFEDQLSRETDLKDQDPELIFGAFQTFLKEFSPKYNCPRWQSFRKAAGWTICFRSFIEDRQRLADYLYKTNPDYIEAVAWLAQDRAERYALYAAEKKEIAREKELVRRGFHSS